MLRRGASPHLWTRVQAARWVARRRGRAQEGCSRQGDQLFEFKEMRESGVWGKLGWKSHCSETPWRGNWEDSLWWGVRRQAG